MAYNMLMCR